MHKPRGFIWYVNSNSLKRKLKNCSINSQLTVKGNDNMVEILLNNGADSNLLNGYKETPLHYAVRHGNLVPNRYLILTTS